MLCDPCHSINSCMCLRSYVMSKGLMRKGRWGLWAGSGVCLQLPLAFACCPVCCPYVLMNQSTSAPTPPMQRAPSPLADHVLPCPHCRFYSLSLSSVLSGRDSSGSNYKLDVCKPLGQCNSRGASQLVAQQLDGTGVCVQVRGRCVLM